MQQKKPHPWRDRSYQIAQSRKKRTHRKRRRTYNWCGPYSVLREKLGQRGVSHA